MRRNEVQRNTACVARRTRSSTSESPIRVSPLSPTQVNELLHEAAPNSTIFLIGAGGCGMSGLGHLLLDLGFSVAGSDLAVSEEIHQIRSRGGEIHIGHDPQQVVAARPLLARSEEHTSELQSREKLVC